MGTTKNDDDAIEMTAFQLRNMLMAAWRRGAEYGTQCVTMDRLISANNHVVDMEIDAHTVKVRSVMNSTTGDN